MSSAPTSPAAPTTPPGWYPDPGAHGLVRYWDGTRWTEHTSPAVAAAATSQPPAKRGMSGGAIAAIVVGSIVAAFVVIGILAAIAIPVFLNQKEKAADAAARSSVTDIGNQIFSVTGMNPANGITVTAMGPSVVILGGDDSARTAVLEPGVSFGNYTAGEDGAWCVWVSASDGDVKEYQFSSWGRLEPGSCSP